MDAEVETKSRALVNRLNERMVDGTGRFRFLNADGRLPFIALLPESGGEGKLYALWRRIQGVWATAPAAGRHFFVALVAAGLPVSPQRRRDELPKDLPVLRSDLQAAAWACERTYRLVGGREPDEPVSVLTPINENRADVVAKVHRGKTVEVFKPELADEYAQALERCGLQVGEPAGEVRHG